MKRQNIIDFKKGAASLSKKDKTIKAVLSEIGLPKPTFRNFDSKALIRTVVRQQLSDRAATTIFQRLTVLLNDNFDPNAIVKFEIDKLRACGLSRSKAMAVLGISSTLKDQPLFLEKILHLPDNEAIKVLSSLPGIGNWSAAIILLFSLQRPNILPVGDVSLNKAINALYGVEIDRRGAALDSFKTLWSPHCSVASLILWHWIDSGSKRIGK